MRDPEKARARYAKWLANNPGRNAENQRAYRARRYAADGFWRDSGPKAVAMRAFMVEIKSAPCADCGLRFDACCMDFDHRAGETKVNNVGTMFAHHHSLESIEAEIAKCDLVCANCHRIRTRDRRVGSGGRRAARV